MVSRGALLFCIAGLVGCQDADVPGRAAFELVGVPSRPAQEPEEPTSEEPPPGPIDEPVGGMSTCGSNRGQTVEDVVQRLAENYALVRVDRVGENLPEQSVTASDDAGSLTTPLIEVPVRSALHALESAAAPPSVLVADRARAQYVAANGRRYVANGPVSSTLADLRGREASWALVVGAPHGWVVVDAFAISPETGGVAFADGPREVDVLLAAARRHVDESMAEVDR